jgi:hypothetical protein
VVNMWILVVRPRNRLMLPARFISPLLIDFQSPSHTSSTTPFTGSWLVSVQVYWRGLASIDTVKFRLLVLYVTEGASLLYFQYNSVYWFTTGVCASLLKGSRCHSSSNTQITSFWLVLYVTEGTSLPYFQSNSVYWFTTSIHANKLKGPRPHRFSNV